MIWLKKKNNKEASKFIVFIEAYKSNNEDFKIIDIEFKLLNEY